LGIVPSSFGDCDVATFCPFSAETITMVSSRIKSTSPGPEGIPFWLYKSCAVKLGSVVAKSSCDTNKWLIVDFASPKA